jgi:HEAT repeat protein
MMKLCALIAAFTATAISQSPAGAPPSQPVTRKAWGILQQALVCKRASKRANAAHALRLVHDNPRAEEMLERALDDPSAKVRAAAARALGTMGAKSSVAKLKTMLDDRDPLVVLAAAHSLFLLGEREAAYDVDYQVLIGERRGANGFVHSQLQELRDPKVVAMMGVETGIGFLPFGGEGYEFYKRISKDDGTPVRVTVAKELATDRDPKIDAALARACSDKKSAVRAAAIFTIAKRDNPALLSAIAPALEDKNEIVRYEAAAAVLRLSGAPSSN